MQSTRTQALLLNKSPGITCPRCPRAACDVPDVIPASVAAALAASGSKSAEQSTHTQTRCYEAKQQPRACWRSTCSSCINLTCLAPPRHQGPHHVESGALASRKPGPGTSGLGDHDPVKVETAHGWLLRLTLVGRSQGGLNTWSRSISSLSLASVDRSSSTSRGSGGSRFVAWPWSSGSGIAACKKGSRRESDRVCRLDKGARERQKQRDRNRDRETETEKQRQRNRERKAYPWDPKGMVSPAWQNTALG